MDQKNKLFVGSLDFSVTSDELKQAFEQFGSITDAVVVIDKFTGRSRGFGFVTYETAEMANAAAAAMNDQELKGRKIVVSVARPQAPRENRGGGGFSPRGGGFDRGSDRRQGGNNRY